MTPRLGEEKRKNTFGEEENKFHFECIKFGLFMGHTGNDGQQRVVCKP